MGWDAFGSGIGVLTSSSGFPGGARHQTAARSFQEVVAKYESIVARIVAWQPPPARAGGLWGGGTYQGVDLLALYL